MALTSRMEHPYQRASVPTAIAEPSTQEAPFLHVSPGASVTEAMLKALRRVGQFLYRTSTRARITLCVEDGHATVAVFQGRNVVSWASANLAGGSAAGEGREDVSEAALLKKLLTEMGVAGRRVIMDLPSYACLTRNLRLPGVPGKYRGPVIVSEVLKTVPFSGDEVDVSWTVRRARPGHSVAATVVPRGVLARRVKLLGEAGVRPVAAFSRSASLAFAAGLNDGIIVHLATGTDVITVRDGVPQVTQHLAPVPEDATPRQESL